jgi:Zinc carboxypeptidase
MMILIMKKHAIHLRSAMLLALAFLILPSLAPSAEAANDLSRYAFPMLGARAERKVNVEWNRLYDSEGLAAIISKLHKAYPHLTRLYSIGKSSQGRDLWCLEVTAFKVGDARRKAGMYIDGNIHGNEVQGGEVVAYTAWYLCTHYGHLDKVTQLLDERVFYLLPTINPDGRDNWFNNPQTSNSSRGSMKPYDSDRDGLTDEDGYDDLNKDGVINRMWKKDPNGRHKPHPDFPHQLMIQVADDEVGQYTLLGNEGIDNDGDGRTNEDGPGGCDLNRNWGFSWRPNHIQGGAHEYPFSLPETRAVSEFVRSHPNIAAMQSFHNTGGMILRGPGNTSFRIQPQDDKVLAIIGERGKSILPSYRSLVTYSDLYTIWGEEKDWFYGARGILSFTNELWTSKNLIKSGSRANTEERALFREYVLLGEGMVEWEDFEHPSYGKILIGGSVAEWGRIPPSFLLEEECHRNMAFTLYHADMMPQLRISEVKIDELSDGLHKIWVTVGNLKLMPTRTRQEILNHISPPDVVSLSGKRVEVLSSGIVLDPYHDKIRSVRHRPRRVELSTIGGMSSKIVQFIVSGSGHFTIEVDSARGGLIEHKQAL